VLEMIHRCRQFWFRGHPSREHRPPAASLSWCLRFGSPIFPESLLFSLFRGFVSQIYYNGEYASLGIGNHYVRCPPGRFARKKKPVKNLLLIRDLTLPHFST